MRNRPDALDRPGRPPRGPTRRRRRWPGSSRGCRRRSRPGRSRSPAPRAACGPPRPRRCASSGSGDELDRAGDAVDQQRGARRRSSSPRRCRRRKGSRAARAMIAVWLVGPPRSVTRATTTWGRGSRCRTGARSSATSTDGVVGQLHAGLRLAHEVGDHASFDVAQVGGPLGHQTAHRREHGDELLDGRADRGEQVVARCAGACAPRSAAPCRGPGRRWRSAPPPRDRRPCRRGGANPSPTAPAASSYVASPVSSSYDEPSKRAIASGDTSPRTTRAGAKATPGTTGVPCSERGGRNGRSCRHAAPGGLDKSTHTGVKQHIQRSQEPALTMYAEERQQAIARLVTQRGPDLGEPAGPGVRRDDRDRAPRPVDARAHGAGPARARRGRPAGVAAPDRGRPPRA